MLKREFTDLDDFRLLHRGNKILLDLFRTGNQSIRKICANESEAKAFYRFLQNDRVDEEDILANMISNCQNAAAGKALVCIQDTTEINLSSHRNRIHKNSDIGTTNANKDHGLGFFVHPSLVLDAFSGIPYGYADVKVWNRNLDFKSKYERQFEKLPIEEKDSVKWLEVSQNTKMTLKDTASQIIIVQDREGDIYDQFALIPDERTALVIRACRDRLLTNKERLFTCLDNSKIEGTYEVEVDGKGGRKKRKAIVEVKYKEVEITRPKNANKNLPNSINVFLIEAKEKGYDGSDAIHWRILTSIPVQQIEAALLCIEWYRWRWTIEEVFKVLKKEGFNIEASELEYASSIRKLTLMILEVTIKLFLMRIAYTEPETNISPDSCFSQEEQEFLEHQIAHLEGKTEKQKNPFKTKDLKRYVWAIARLGGWKGYESKRHPGITTLWVGLQRFKDAMSGWKICRNVSTR